MAKAFGGRVHDRDKILAQVCEWVSSGKTVSEFCRQPGMPDRMTVNRWVNEDKEAELRFIEAREAGFDVIAEECMRIADDTSHDTIVDDNGRRRVDAEWVNRSRLRVETRLKLLSKWSRRFRDGVEITGANGGPLEFTKIEREIIG